MKKAFIYNNYNNIVVLKEYLEVIRAALLNNGFEVEYVKSIENLEKSNTIVFPMAIDAFKYYLRGYRNIILWQQGVTADESFLRNNSRVRHYILNKIDTFVMRKAKLILFVSEYMRKHYERISKTDFSSKSYIMPCFNEKLDSSILDSKNYNNMVFAYVGSLDLWQCFEKTVKLYKKIEDKYPNAFFKVLTFQVDEANQILQKNGVKNYSVKCVPKEEVKQELVECTYGFIIREDNIVNRVATPTKLSSYLSTGTLPIFSSCLTDFDATSKGLSCCYSLKYIEDEAIDDFISKKHELDKIKKDIEYLFDGYYSVEKHKAALSEIIRIKL